MYALDFEYDGRLLSSFGYIICYFDGSNGLNIENTGFQITFNKVSRNHGRKNSLTTTQYDECMKTTFHICKNPDLFENLEITNDEYRELVRWLNRHEFLRFRIISELEGLNRVPCYFNASFNIGKIYIADILYGLELTAETDSPFGYGARYEREWTVPTGGRINMMDISDETGFTRPDITITCNGSGDLVMSNLTTGNTMKINNCVTGEIINVYGDRQIITTNQPSHKIYNDFNYEFLALSNTYGNIENEITFSLPCTVRIGYAPVIKDIP